MKERSDQRFWRSLNLLLSQFFTILFRFIRVFISLRPCLNPYLFSYTSILCRSPLFTYKIQDYSAAFAFSSAKVSWGLCLPSGQMMISSKRVYPVSQSLCIPCLPEILTCPWRIIQKWLYYSSIWYSKDPASLSLILPKRSKETPITLWTFLKKGLND